MVFRLKDKTEDKPRNEIITEIKNEKFSIGYGVRKGLPVLVESLAVLAICAHTDKSTYQYITNHLGMSYLAALVPATPVALSAGWGKLKELRRKSTGENQPA